MSDMTEKPSRLTGVDHPDLQAIDRAISARLDAILDAEQHAMEVFVRRQATLRDRLLDLEDGSETVEVTTRGGIHRGVLRTAAVDHVELTDGARSIIIPLRRLDSVETG